ncbi:MAG TPA: pseudouridine synthase [Gordonia sp. (in: high G+C Gram-positive bacteria)]|uniref:pseudouridine synthase n=1 Tax=unclassified Gordonia (in: high G+C Gram-positive bacteria) TaxID=2657482 RepID=UPI000F91ADA2|nr:MULTISPECIES: pseudouridine synthase [unclassified Gordonia (in: high G+C Gram-positive bacteria)]RUP40160.1 MAG: rRNA pseudouridine synthase [Gordonia sp. (in: high G+C Gram-positive bacteria)]HNP55877.1 pseudouridine synthase [Gordonia sp. (in: high G+C Gram-positive bacteria)]HRC52138.1 pseudouridine synthase [Gordonia sp. (in: high G+C Gram-positive bacteria)]
MASASRDGTPGPRKSGGKSQTGGKGRPPAGKKNGPRKGGPSKGGAPKGGKPRQRSRVDAESGKVRLNNAKPAKRQHLPADDRADGEFVGTTAAGDPYNPEGTRLQKVLASAGVASRRGAEELIAAGRVSVDGVVVTEQGMRVDPRQVIVRVDGVRVLVDEDMTYLALNKPTGYHSTMADDQGRPCVGDLVAERVMAGQRLFHVGRLDADTEGLLLLTNDGELAHRLMHPSFEVPKTYLATVRGEVPRSLSRRVRDGVDLDDGPVKADEFVPLQVWDGSSLVRITLHEGRNRVVRRLMDELGFPVTRLVRTDVGPIALGEQRPGSIRVLGRDEIGALYKAVGL